MQPVFYGKGTDMIQIDHAIKTFAEGSQAVHALRDVSLKVEKGDIYGIVGFSGAGKSTLLRLVNDLEKHMDAFFQGNPASANYRSAYSATACPCSADFRNHSTAFGSSGSIPSPRK